MNLSDPQVTIKGLRTQISIPFIGPTWYGNVTYSNTYSCSGSIDDSYFYFKEYIIFDVRLTMMRSSDSGVSAIPLIELSLNSDIDLTDRF